jgi:transcriptional regulator with XRE-family HTH domain
MPEFPVWLKARMDEHNLNASGLARKIGLSHVAIGRWLRAERQPDNASIAKLARLFALSTTEVYTVLGRIPAPRGDPSLEEIIALWDRVPGWKRQDLLDQTRLYAGRDADETE